MPYTSQSSDPRPERMVCLSAHRGPSCPLCDDPTTGSGPCDLCLWEAKQETRVATQYAREQAAMSERGALCLMTLPGRLPFIAPQSAWRHWLDTGSARAVPLFI